MSAIAPLTADELKSSVIPGIFADPILCLLASGAAVFARVLNRRVARIATLGVTA